MSEIELRFGRWQDVLADAECDALICDPPYSPRVHEGQRTGTETAKATITYDALSPEMAHEFAEHWAPRTRFWAVIFSDHLGARWWEEAWLAQGWYVFAPVLWLRENATPRVAGDGPTSSADYLTVARPRRRLPSERTGSRRGHYKVRIGAWNVERTGGKPIDGMRAILRDYTLRDDLIADPFAGAATTLLAAREEGRRAIGAEMDPEAYEVAQRRLASGWTPDLFGGAA